MKKLITIALLCAMLLSCFASCGSMQVGELDVDAYADDAAALDVAVRTEIDPTNVDTWDKTTYDTSWYEKAKEDGEYTLTTAEEFMGFLSMLSSYKKAAEGDIVIAGAKNTPTYSFADIVIKLGADFIINPVKKDVDKIESLDDFDGTPAAFKEIAGNGNVWFSGTFDGQGHVVSGLYQRPGSNNRSIFGPTYNATIKNVSFVNTYFYSLAEKDNSAKATSLLTIWSMGEINISGVYWGGIVRGATSNIGLIGQVNPSKYKVETYQTGADGANTDLEAVNKITVSDTEVDVQIIENAGAAISTIIGKVSSAAKEISLTNVKGTISAKSAKDYKGGLIGQIGAKVDKVVLKNCEANIDLEGANNCGGLIGQVGGSTKTFSIEDCTVNGTLKAKKLSGGVIGYLSGTAQELNIKNVKVDGSISGDRSAAGVVGYLSAGDAVFENVVVSAAMNFDLTDVKNQNAGGLIGRIDYCKTLLFKDCVVDGTINARYSSSAAAEDGVATTYVGGLLGYCKAVSTKIKIQDCQVGTPSKAVSMNLSRVNKAVGAYAGIYVGGATKNDEGEQCTIECANVSNNITPIVDEGIVFDVAGPNTLEPFALRVVGYQTRDNGNGTYDLRYVIAAQDLFDGLGVKANIRYVDSNGVFDEKNQKIYVDTVYTYVMDEEMNLYAAEDYYYDYLYTLVVKGVPAEYTFENENLQVILKPFGATNVDGIVTEKEIGFLNHGEKNLANTSAKDMGIDIDNFSNTLDDKYVAEDAIFIPGESYDVNASIGVHTGVKAGTAECRGEYGPDAADPLAAPYHFYLDTASTAYRDVALLNITYNFKVAESGWYDMCIDMRMKGSGTNGNGANKRETLMLVDWAGGEQAYDLSFDLENVTDIKTDSAGSYMTGVKIWVEAGEHTLSFTADPSFGSSYYHIRNIYLVKAD